MNIEQKILAGLAKFEHQTIEPVLVAQAKEIATILHSTVEYETIKQQIGLLSDISFRVPKETVEIISDFLNRIDGIILTYEKSPYRLEELDNKTALISKALGVLHRIRYQELEAILPIFLEYSLAENEDVKKQAKRGLELTADWSFDILKRAGYYPQDTIIKYLQGLDDDRLKKHLMPISFVCDKLLSTTISGETWNADSVVLSRGGLKTDEHIQSIRQSALALLQKLYSFADSVAQKRRILNSMQQATHGRDIPADDKNTFAMIYADTVSVLEFCKLLIPKEELEILQDIEHDAYWIHYHKGQDKAVKAAALSLRDLLNANPEYQIFKVLIGFEGIFEDWEAEERERGKFKEIAEYRDNEAKKFVESMTLENFDEWRNRILEYAKIESEDLATFPHFGKFLEYLAIKHSDLALRLLYEEDIKLERFLLPLLSGLWISDREKAKSLLWAWLKEKKHLKQSVRLFNYTTDIDEDLLQALFKQSQSQKDSIALIHFISVAAHQFGQGNKELVSKFFIPSVQTLTDLNEARWIFDFWYRQNLNEIIDTLSETEAALLLDNLVLLDSLDYHAEKVLKAIAKKYPTHVIKFFGKRIIISEAKGVKIVKGYEPVPYDFHELADSLSVVPQQAVEIVRSWYKPKEYGMFSHRGGRLLSNIFPNFSHDFSQALIGLVQEGGEDNWLFVMSILRNYEGQPFLHDVCKELAKVIPVSLTNEVHIILDSTGVVSGPLGLAEAYERKIKEIEPWLEDTNEKVREFAKDHITILERQIEHEKSRAAEEKELRDYQYRSSQ